MNYLLTDEPGVIRTISGTFIDVINPEPDQIHIEDIAHALSHLCRFGGHTPQFFSVAEHSIFCAMNVEPEHQLAALLHDASEAYLIDLPTPIKRIMPDYINAEDRLMKVIAEKFGFDYPFSDEVLNADRQSFDIEWRMLLSGSCFGTMVPGSAKGLFLQTFKEFKSL